MKTPRVGDVVIYHNPSGVPYTALVTAVWSEDCINVVFVSKDEEKTDKYGRQIERETSISHADVNKLHGLYWRFEEEPVVEYKEPLET